MHQVKCPSCDTWLKVNRPVSEGKMRCPKCNAVFVGSTQEVPAAPVASSHSSAARPDAPAHPPRGPANQAARPQGATQRIVVVRKQSVTPAVAVGVVGLAIIFLMVWCYKNITRPGEIRDEQGNVKRYVSREEFRKEGKQPTVPSAAEPSGAATAAQVPSKSAPKQRPPSTPQVAPKAPPVASTPGLKLETPLAYLPEVPGNDGFFHGELRNTSAQAFQSVTLAIRMYDASDKLVGQPKASLKWVAPYQTLRYSADFSESMAKSVEGGTVEPSAVGVPAGPDVVCWKIENEEITDGPRIQGHLGSVRIAGRTSNPTPYRVMSAIVWCDFFTSDLHYVGSAEGKFDESPTIEPNSTVRFSVDFDPDAANQKWVAPERISVVCARVVGTK